jgi:hypothetical protein
VVPALEHHRVNARKTTVNDAVGCDWNIERHRQILQNVLLNKPIEN